MNPRVVTPVEPHDSLGDLPRAGLAVSAVRVLRLVMGRPARFAVRRSMADTLRTVPDVSTIVDTGNAPRRTPPLGQPSRTKPIHG